MSDRTRVAVLGQGIAGTLVSMRLRENGVPHVVIDRGHLGASSYAAAGLVNPVTGRRFVLVEDFERYRSRFGIYARLTELLGRTYVSPITIYRDLSRVKDRNQWDMRRSTAAYSPYLGSPLTASAAGLPVADKHQWLGPTYGAYRVDLPGLIADYRALLSRERALIPGDAPTATLPRVGSAFVLLGSEYDVVIDCRGAACAKTAEWGSRAWRLSKGESIRFRAAGFPRDGATKLGGCFLVPIGNGREVWYGGTSTDRFAVDTPEVRTRDRFTREVARLLEGGAASSSEVTAGAGPERWADTVDHRAAIRPTTTDRLPVVGPHADLPGLFVCSGLGTKGALTAPSITARLWSMVAPVLGRRP